MKDNLLNPTAVIAAALIAAKPNLQEIGQVKDLFLKVYEEPALAEKEHLSRPQGALSVSPEAIAKSAGHGSR